MPSRVRVATPEEEKAFESTAGGGGSMVRVASPEEERAFEATGEAGGAGHDPYAPGETEKRRAQSNVRRNGDWVDLAKSLANSAALGAGPQIAGAIGAGMAPPNQTLDAYRDVRDETARELRSSGDTLAGDVGGAVGTLVTPIPIKPLGRGASIGEKALQGAKVGGVAGLIHGAATSKGDATKLDSDNWARLAGDALTEGAVGALGGGAAGAVLSPVEGKLTSTAEEQALRAAGLRGGIKNSIKKDLGLSNMDEARALGRQFLDEDLIPPIGSSEAVGRRAEALQSRAGNAKGAVLNAADVSGSKFDFTDMADAARRQLDAESAVATDLSGAKASALADALERQGAKTPGSFVGADKAKSDAWKSANFADDAPMAAQLYRKSVGAARDDIERQVGDALGPDAASTLASANEKYGIGADALKLSENASTRDAAKQGVTTGDLLALLSGGTAGGLAGHPTAGIGTGLGLAVGKKAFDRYGHSSAARFADFLGKKAADNSGGSVGARGANSLAEYFGLMEDDEP